MMKKLLVASVFLVLSLYFHKQLTELYRYQLLIIHRLFCD